MTNRSTQGKPVLPDTISREEARRRKAAFWNCTKESGLRVKPRSLNADAEVKIDHHPLEAPIELMIGMYVCAV